MKSTSLEECDKILKELRENFKTWTTITYQWRVDSLRSLWAALEDGAKDYAEGAKKDLGWSELDTQLELGLIYSNIDNSII